MKRFTFYGLCAIFLILSFFLTSCYGKKNNSVWFTESKAVKQARAKNEPLWKRFKKDLDRHYYAKAGAVLDSIYGQSVSNNLPDEAIKARAVHCILDGKPSNDGSLEIVRLKKEIPSMPASVRPLMYLILGHLYCKCFGSLNRGDSLDVSGFYDSSFSGWSAKKYFTEINSCYDKVFKDEEFLKKTRLCEFRKLFEMGDAPLNLRPTVFDFVVYDAINFYSSCGDNFAIADTFAIDISSAAFADAPEFIAYEPETTDKYSCKYKVLQLYQKLLSFHKDDIDADAFIDADISRLNYVYYHSTGLDEKRKQELYLKRMETIIKKYPSSQVTAMAYFHSAVIWWEHGEAVKAASLVDAAQKKYPASLGAALCKKLEGKIKNKKLSIDADSMVEAGKEFKVYAESRNVNSLMVGIYKAGRSMLSGDEPLKKLTFPVQTKGDYGIDRTELSIPAPEPGGYDVLVSCSENFKCENNIVLNFSVTSSGLVLMTRTVGDIVKTFVMDAGSGKPVSGVKAERRISKGSKTVQSAKSDENGLFEFEKLSGELYQRDCSVSVSNGRGDEIFNPDYYKVDSKPWTYHYSGNSVVFFTDRSVYRPGQKIFFKAVAFAYDNDSGKCLPLPDYKLEVFLKKQSSVFSHKSDKAYGEDNVVEIGSLSLNTDKSGSVYGTFTIPADLSSGGLELSCSSMYGINVLSVKEYKHPEFFVKLEPPNRQLRLGDEVTVPGTVTSGRGKTLKGAKVVYSVKRSVNYLPWYGSESSPADEQEIACGSTVTDESGRFSIPFKSSPDLSVDKSCQPVFCYKVSADVTGTSGATGGDDRIIKLGYCKLQSFLACNEWQTAKESVKMAISTSTLAGRGIAAAGKIRIVSLKQPLLPLPEKEHNTVLPADEYKLDDWPVMAVIEERNVKTSGDGTGFVAFKLKPGAYRAEFSCQDQYGEKSEFFGSFIVIDEKSKSSAVCLPSYFMIEKTSLAVGETFKGVWGSGYKQGMAYVQILKDGKTLTSYWTPPGQTQVPVTVPVTKEMRGGFTVSLFTVKGNRFYSHIRKIDVPFAGAKLSPPIESLRSKHYYAGQDRYTEKYAFYLKEDVPPDSSRLLYDNFIGKCSSDFVPSLSALIKDDTNINDDFINASAEVSYLVAPVERRAEAPWVLYPSWSPVFGIFYAHHKYYPYNAAFPEDNLGGNNDFFSYDYKYRLIMKSVDSDLYKSLLFSHMKTISSGTPDIYYIKRLDSGHFREDVYARKDFPETVFSACPSEAGIRETVTLRAKTPDLPGSKKLLVETDAPHLLRQGGVFEFTVKAANLTAQDTEAEISIDFFDPASGKKLNAELKHSQTAKTVNLPCMQSRAVSWMVKIPDGLQNIAYRSSAKSSIWIDSEESELPVAAVKKL